MKEDFLLNLFSYCIFPPLRANPFNTLSLENHFLDNKLKIVESMSNYLYYLLPIHVTFWAFKIIFFSLKRIEKRICLIFLKYVDKIY